MRNSFRGYYPPSDEELNELWGSGSIILDANALLNLFRYSNTTREGFFSVLVKLQDRLWIPSQVGKEFHLNRLNVIEKQRTAFFDIRKELEASQRSFENTVKGFSEHSSLEADTLLKKYMRATSTVQREMKRQEESAPKGTSRGHSETEIWNEITRLFDGKVGKMYSQDELSTIYDEGSKRYESKVPPGYKDSDKGEPRKYGDLILWKQILERAKLKSDSAIFVTDDGKEDWWWIYQGRTLGPRPELVDEYFESSNGKRIHFYSPKEFLDKGKTLLKIEVSDDSLREVQKVSTQESDRKRTQEDRETIFRRKWIQEFSRRLEGDSDDSLINDEEERRRSFERDQLARQADIYEAARRAEMDRHLLSRSDEFAKTESDIEWLGGGSYRRVRNSAREESLRNQLYLLHHDRDELGKRSAKMSPGVYLRRAAEIDEEIALITKVFKEIDEQFFT